MYVLCSVSMKKLNQELKFCLVRGRWSGSWSSSARSEEMAEN